MRIGLGSGMAELNAGRQDRRAGPCHPCYQRLFDLSLFQSLNDPVLVFAAQFAKTGDHLDGRVLFVTQDVVEQCRSWIAITSDGHSFVNAVRISGDDVEGLVEHASRFGDETHTSRPVELGGDDILDGPCSIADTEGPCRHAAHCGWTDDDLMELSGCGTHDARLPLRHALGNDGHGSNCLLLQCLHGGLEGGTVTGKVHHYIGFRIGLGRQGDCLVHGQNDLFSSPECLMNAGSAGIDDSRDAGRFTFADVVEVQHALDGIGLIAVDECFSIFIKENVFFPAH